MADEKSVDSKSTQYKMYVQAPTAFVKHPFYITKCKDHYYRFKERTRTFHDKLSFRVPNTFSYQL